MFLLTAGTKPIQMKGKLKTCLLAAFLMGAFSAPGFADTIAITPANSTGVIGGGTTPTPLAVVYTADAGGLVTNGIQVDIVYDPNVFTATPAAANGAVGTVSCALSPAGVQGRIRLIAAEGSSSQLPNNTYCNITFAIAANAAASDYSLDVEFGPAGTVSQPDGSDNTDPHTLSDGVVTVAAAPPTPVTLSYTPPSGNGGANTVTFPAGLAGATVTDTIDVTPAGTSGTGSVTNCALSGADAASFAVTSGNLTINPGVADTIDLSCTLGAAQRTATLTCTEIDGDTAAPGAARSWPLVCLAGGAVPAAVYGSTPAPGGTLTFTGAANAQVTRTLTINNTGNLAMTANCTTNGAGFAITAGGAPQNVAAGGSLTVTVQGTIPGDGSTATGTLDCETDAANIAGGNATYNLSAAAGAPLPPPIPQANIIPAGSFWSNLMIVGFIAGVGVLVLTLRRNG